MASTIPVEDKFAHMFTDPVQEQKFHNILMLVEIILFIPVSTAVCERGFSTMKRIRSDWRSTLSAGMLDALMNIAIKGPHYTELQAENAVMAWYFNSQRSRRPDFEWKMLNEKFNYNGSVITFSIDICIESYWMIKNTQE